MRYVVLPSILEREGPDFYHITRAWKPKDLLPDPFRRNLLKDAQRRLDRMDGAEAEFQSLDRATLYLNALKRMRFAVRQAQFAWRVDDLKFLQNLAEFFSDYGTVLQNLKVDKARGRFDEPQAVGV